MSVVSSTSSQRLSRLVEILLTSHADEDDGSSEDDMASLRERSVFVEVILNHL